MNKVIYTCSGTVYSHYVGMEHSESTKLEKQVGRLDGPTRLEDGRGLLGAMTSLNLVHRSSTVGVTEI